MLTFEIDFLGCIFDENDVLLAVADLDNLPTTDEQVHALIEEQNAPLTMDKILDCFARGVR